jgi:phosphopantothenoylcysteine decarboxylase/phosphopantothenate--cysteine ligase
MKNIVLIVTGSIAAQKSEKLFYKLKENYNVEVIFTESSKKFATDEFLKEEKEVLFYKDKFVKGDDSPHIKLSDWCDAVIVYPATHNFIGKVANGLSNDLASILLTAVRKPVLFFEAMNETMLENVFYLENKNKIKDVSNMFVFDAKYGKLANGSTGWGRLWEVDEVAEQLKSFLNDFKNLDGKKILLNFGRTKRKIDSVRFISNGSSGQLGKAIFDSAKMFTNNLKGFFGDNDLAIKENAKLKYCPANDMMLDEIKKEFNDADVFIASAALTDFKVENELDSKISKRENPNPEIKLVPDVDVLGELGKIKTKQFLVGFCLLDKIDLDIARQKLVEKNCDMMIANESQTMSSSKMKAVVINNFNSDVIEIEMTSKIDFANQLFKLINEYFQK